MKSSVKVPYLYLTTDPQIVTKLTFDQGWLPTIADLGDVDFVIGPSVTDKLIGFELNYNYEGQKYGLATLELLDIDGNLESRFIQKSANFIFTNYYSTLKKNPELASDYEEYSKIVNTNKTPKFFLGFGLSENISEWSGPYIGSVIRTDMSLDGTGLKKITVQLQLTDNSFELKTHDPAIHKGYISDIVARNLPQVNMVAAGGVVMPILEFLSSDPTDVLSSAISDYLKVVSDTKNILTILPDLSYSKNLTLSKQRQKDVQAGTSTFSIFGIIPASNKNFNSFQKFDTSPSRYSKKLNYSQYQDLVYFPTIRKYYKNFGADVIIIPETYEVVKTKVPKKRATTPPKVANDNSFNSRDPRIPENLGRQLERLSSLRTTYSQELKRAVYNQDQQAQQDASKKLKKAISDSNQLKAEIQQKYLNQPEKKQTPSEDDFDYQEKRIAKDVNWVNATPSIDADMAFYEENSYLLNLAQSKVLVQFSISSEQSKDETGQESNTKPDFYLPIKKLTEGFNNFKINDSFEPFKANFGVFYENNPTIVKKWMEYNLLENKPERDIDCVLLLTSDQIRTHWVYGHTTPMNIDITQRGECPIQQKFVDVFNNKDYRKSLSKISKYFKKGSSFNELDSLEGSNQLIKDVFRLSEDFNVETSMSVFLSNTKNSNVISFNLATYPQYIGIFNYGIETLSQQLTTDTFAMADAKSLIKGAINSFDKDLKPIEKELLHYFFDDEIFRGLSADVMKRREGPVSLDPSKNTSNLPTQQDKDVLAKWNGSVRRAGFDYKINKDTQSSQVYKKIDGVFKKLAKNNDYGFDPNAIEDSKKLMEAVFTDLSKNEELEGVDLKLKELVDTVSPDKLAAFLTKIYTMNKSAFSTKIVNYKRNPKYLQEELFRFMSNSYLELNIKTLPFFHVDGSHFGKNCLFVHNELVALPLVARRLSFLTGLYFINGFRHIINSSECYSEFSLKKVPTSIEDGETENETQPEIEDVKPSESPTPASPTGPITGKGAPTGGMFGSDLRPKFEFDAKDPRIPDRIKDRYIRTLNAIAEYEDAEVSGELELTREPDKSYLKKRYDENRLLRSKLESDIKKFTSPSVQQELNNKNRTETTSKQQETRIKVNTSDSRIPEELRQRYNQASQERDNAVLNLKRAVSQNDRTSQAQYSEDIKTANRRLNGITIEMAEYTGQLSSGTSTNGVRRSE